MTLNFTLKFMKDFKMRNTMCFICCNDGLAGGSDGFGAQKLSVRAVLLSFVHNSDVKSKLIFFSTTNCILLPGTQ